MLFSKTKKVVSIALAVTMIFTAQLGASAAVSAKSKNPVKVANLSTTATPALQIIPGSIVLDGASVVIDTVTQGEATLVNARTFANNFGATIFFVGATKTVRIKKDETLLEAQLNNKFIKVNGESKFMTYAPRSIQGKLFLEVTQLVHYMGGQIIENESGKEFTSFKLLEGLVNPEWLNESTVLATVETETGFDHYTINTTNRKYTKLNISVATEIVEPSPDGTKLAYTDDNGNVYLYNLAFNTETKISSDTLTKLELTWSGDSSTLYYIEGEKQTNISKMTLEGTITKAFNESPAVDYKSDLFVLGNSTLLYTVSKPASGSSTPTLTDGNDIPDFDVTINPAGTEPTLYTVDLTATTPAAVKITTTLENKTYSGLLSNKSAVFFSTALDDETAVPNIKVVDTSLNTTTQLLYNVELISAKIIDDKLIALGLVHEEDAEGNLLDETQFLFEIDPIKGKAKKLAELPIEVSSVTIGAAKNQVIAQDGEGKTSVWKSGKLFLVAN